MKFLFYLGKHVKEHGKAVKVCDLTNNMMCSSTTVFLCALPTRIFLPKILCIIIPCDLTRDNSITRTPDGLL